MHLILAHRALDLFFPPGDYNRNVASDAGDYIAFRKGLGTTYMPIDYNIWRAHFGQTTPGGSGPRLLATSRVPSPSRGALSGCLFACCRLSEIGVFTEWDCEHSFSLPFSCSFG